VSQSVSRRIKICTIFLYSTSPVQPAEQATSSSTLGQKSDSDYERKTTALMLAFSKIVRVLRLDPNVFQQLSEIF